MKQLKRILSFLMAIVILSSFINLYAGAKAPYKDADIPASQYDDLDKPTFTTNQCASMALDYVDKMLKETNDKDGSLVIDLSVLGTLNLTSVDNALNGIYDLINGALWTIFKGLMGDLADLDKSAISSARRASTPAATADLNVIYSLIDFLSDNRTIISKAIDGSLDMGLANSFVDLSEINVNQMLKGMLFPMAYPDVTPVPDPVTQTVDQMVQDIIETLLVGTTEEPGLFPGMAGHIDIVNSTTSAYDFGEQFLRDIYNIVLVPLLNTDVKKLVRELCGVVYDPLNPDDPGDESNLNEYAAILDIHYTVPVHTFAAGATLVTDINSILGEITAAVIPDFSGWAAGGNSLALSNATAALKYVLANTGSAFFADYVPALSPAEINAMTGQQVFSYLLRSALNSTISTLNIPADADTLVEVAWYALKEVLAEKVPQNNYSAQPKTLDGVLYMLADTGVYYINRLIDMNPAAAAMPGAGLLAYGQGLDATLTAVMTWFKTNYGSLFSVTLSSTSGWAALDTLVFSIAQSNWLPASVGGSTKELIVNRILRDILDLNTTNLFALFDRRADSEFATKTVKKTAIDTAARLVNVVFPGAMGNYTSFETAFSNAELKGIVERLLLSLYNRRTSIIPAILPLLTNVMGLSSPQAFANPELLVPNQIGAATSFTINNESTGLNTGATNKAGTFTQDALYKIKIVSLTSSIPAITLTNLVGTVINGGDSVTCSIGGTFAANNVLRITMTYDVYTELGTKLTDVPLTAMAFSYISGVLDDGRNFIAFDNNTNNKHTSYYKSTYLNQNAAMTEIAGAQVQVKREKTSAVSHSYEATVSRSASTVNASLVGVTAAAFTNATTTYDGGTWTFPIYVVDPLTAVRPADGIYTSTFTYGATKTSLTGGTETWQHSGKSYVVFYSDFGLPGLLSSELDKRRDPTSYSDADAWDTYLDAMRNAVSVVYKPRQASTFMTQIAPAFEAAQIYLAESVAALEASEIAGNTGEIIEAIHAVHASNLPGLSYDDPSYNYFGIADFVPYTYLNYIKVENESLAICESQTAPAAPVLPSNPTPEQQDAFNIAYAQYLVDLAAFNANKPYVSPADVMYAVHRINLYAGRLIPVQAAKARLNEVISAIGSPVEALYTRRSWAAFAKALAFAQAVNAQSTTEIDAWGNYVLRQSKADTAREKLIEAYKQLVLVSDYTQLDAYIVEAETYLLPISKEADYTPESWAIFVAAYNAAKAVPREMPKTDANQAKIDAAATALYNSMNTLVPGSADYTQLDAYIREAETYFNVAIPYWNPYTSPYPYPYPYPYPDPYQHGYTQASWDRLVAAFIHAINVERDMSNTPANQAIIDNAAADLRYAIDHLESIWYPPWWTHYIWLDGPGGSGTGSILKLLDDNNNIVASFIGVMLGDVNGDASIDSIDAGTVVDRENYIVDWSAPINKCFLLAADVNNDYSIDSIDAGMIVDCENYMNTFDYDRDLPDGFIWRDAEIGGPIWIDDPVW